MSTDIIKASEAGLSETGGESAAMDIATARQAQEVQAAMVVAKRFPRDETAALQRILRACKRPTLAEQAIYTYPRGGQRVSGPSIRLAEAMAQAWGNIDFGVVELEQKAGESVCMSYAWDLETNTRQTKTFTVRHERLVNDRETGGKRRVLLEDPRDVYEMVANQGARRVRNCIIGVIPGDVVDIAVSTCNKTLTGQSDRPLADRIRDMVIAFAELGVTQEMIEARLGHSIDACVEQEFVHLRGIYKSLQDDMSKREDWFDIAPVTAEAPKKTAKKKSRSSAVAEKMNPQEEAPPTPPEAADAPEEDEPADASPEAIEAAFKTLQEACFNVQNENDIADVRQSIEDSILPKDRQNNLFDMLKSASTSFQAQAAEGSQKTLV